jgi:hypothetical protein
MRLGIDNPAVVEHVVIAAFADGVDAQVQRTVQGETGGAKFVVTELSETDDDVLSGAVS